MADGSIMATSGKAAMTASWFEGKNKNDFAENEKRNNDL